MQNRKTFVGPRLRQLRRERRQTQAEMAAALGLSPAYINLLENNQRSLSVRVLLQLSETYGVDWRDLLEDEAPTLLADLRSALQDPVFAGQETPDLQELRAALDHCPKLARTLLALHQGYRNMSERVLVASEAHGTLDKDDVAATTPEAVVHDLFRTERNHFVALERAAEGLFGGRQIPAMEVYSVLKRHLEVRHGVQVAGFETSDDTKSLREFDEENGVLRLADALDYPNRAFQLAHIIGLFGQRGLIDRIVRDAELSGDRVVARCRVELANYFAAAVLMPYDVVLSAAQEARYDIDRIAARFGVSYEQACHRLTTLQRDGAQGIPFFFLRIDKAGNVTKRFNATRFHLAEYGGACPRWDIHFSFRTPGRILPQFVEMPDGERYFTINRTVDRPASGYRNQDHRLAVTLGCPAEFAAETVYADGFQQDDPSIYTPIGINCRLCPRQRCSQRAHQPLHMDLPIDETRRGITRFES